MNIDTRSSSPNVATAPATTPSIPATGVPAAPPELRIFGTSQTGQANGVATRQSAAANQDSATSNDRAQQDHQRRMALAEKMIGANKSLIIEKDADRVGFVYKTIDKATGEVVRVWPQREVASALKALADEDAQAIMSGMLIDARA